MKKRTIKLFSLGALVLGVIALGTFAVAESRKSMEEHVEKFSIRVADELDMNEDQTKALKESMDRILAHRKDFKDMRSSLSDEIVFQLNQGSIDETRLDKMILEKEQKMSEAVEVLKNEFIAMHKTLTPEQRIGGCQRG